MRQITGTAAWFVGILLACAWTTEAQTQFIGEGNSPSINSDGQYVVFCRDINGVSQVFVSDTKVSVNSAGNAANGDYRLQPSSPVINKGANAAPKLPAKDIEGHARILLGKVDMGAYEATGSSPAPVNPSPANAATGVVLTPTLTWLAGLGATSSPSGHSPPNRLHLRLKRCIRRDQNESCVSRSGPST